MAVQSWSFLRISLWRWVTGNAGESFSGSREYINNYLTGGPGNDTITGCGLEFTRMKGEGGDDSLVAGPCGVDMYGGPGQDILQGGVGDDTLHGDEGNDILVGNDGNDSITDMSGDNRIWGGNGNDHVFVRDGVQDVYAGNGNDTIIAQSMDGWPSLMCDLHGEYGNDRIEVDGHAFQAWGGPGNDTIIETSEYSGNVDGEDGNDLIEMYGFGGRATGGAGADTIHFNNAVSSGVFFWSPSESRPGASDTIWDLRGDNRVNLSRWEGLHWADNKDDKSNGALYIENNWTNSRLYAYGANGAVNFEVTFKSSAHLTRDFIHFWS